MYKLAFDVDGVFRDFTGQVRMLARKEGKEIKINNWHFLREDSNRVRGYKLEDLIFTTGEWTKQVFEDAPAIPGSFEVYRKLCEHPDYEVKVVSAQRVGMTHHTDVWLAKNGFTLHEETIYTTQKSLQDIDGLVDDRIKNIIWMMHQKKDGFLIRTEENSKEEFYDLPVYDNLEEVYQRLT